MGSLARTVPEPCAAQPSRRQWLPLVVTGFLCLPALYPLFLPGFVEGHDGVEHVFRVLALATAWREAGVIGNLLPRWTPNLALGFGYPLFGLYSPLAYVFPAGLTLLGVVPLFAVKVALALVLMLGGVGAYLCLRARTGTLAAVAGAITYVYAPYTLANAYVRLDLAELSAGSCAALALAALLRLGDVATTWPVRYRIVLAALPLAAIPLYHNLSALTFLPLFAAVWCLFLVRALRRRQPEGWVHTVLPVLAGPLLAAGLAAFFLLPAWQWQSYTHLALLRNDPAFYAKLLHPLDLGRDHFRLPAWGWFAPGSGWWNFSVAPSAVGELGAGPSSLGWLAVPAGLLLLWRAGAERGLAMALILAGLVSTMLMTTLASPIWRSFDHLTLLQFPWRFAGPLCLATALLVGLLLNLFPVHWRLLPAAGCIVLAMAPALFYLRPTTVAVPAGAITWPVQLRRELVGGYGTTGSGLFLPRWAPGQSPDVPVFPPPQAGVTALHISALAGRADAFNATYEAQKPTPLTLGAWYFPGWRVQIDGQSAPISPDASGLLTFLLPPGTHQLTVARGLTATEIVGGCITVGAALIAIVLLAGRTRAAILGGVGVLFVGIGLSGAIPSVSFSALTSPGLAPSWSLPAVAPSSPALRVAAWRIVRSPVWGPAPVLEVAWLAAEAPVGDEQATVQVRSSSGAVLASTTRGPRLGAVSSSGWPAGTLLFDHLTIPLPPPGTICAGAYTLTLAMGTANSPPTTLGPVTLPCAPAPGNLGDPALPHILASGLHGLGAGRLPVVVPGSTIDLNLSLGVPGPTATDEVLAVQLLDSQGRPLAQAQSYGNVDLRFSSLWRAGQVIPYHLRLSLPEALAVGVYPLTLELFSPVGGALQPLAGPTGAAAQKLTLATVKVAPLQAAARLAPVARFGPSIGLAGPLRPERPILSAQAGATISVPLRWLATGRPAGDYTMFVHLLDARGTLVAQADGPPVEGRYPTSAWDQGELIDDTRQLTLPADLPPGRYTIQVGWYLLATGARLPVTPPVPDDAVSVAEVAIGGH